MGNRQGLGRSPLRTGAQHADDAGAAAGRPLRRKSGQQRHYQKDNDGHHRHKCLGFADEYATKLGLLKGGGNIGRLGLDGCKAVPLLAASVQVGYCSEGSIFDDYDPDEPVDDDRVVVDAGQELPGGREYV